MLKVRHIYISPGHNFVGRHGKTPAEHPLQEMQEIECVAGKGIVGDRYFDHRHDYKGQITFFSWEVFQQLEQELGITGKTPADTRRNVITEGIDLNQLIGKRFTAQGVEFEGAEECRPCYWMDHALKPDAETWLRGRGGLRARILTDGKLKVQQT